MSSTASRVIYNRLHKHGVTDVFCYSGGAIMPLIDHFHKDNNTYGIKHYVNTNEFCSAMSAVGYAKSTGKPGVCIVTSGPGLTNCVTPMLDATNDSTPLIVISGQVPLTAMGSNAFQEAPSVEITTAVTKWSYCVDRVEDVELAIDMAFGLAMDGKKGTVHLDIPKCILTQLFTSQENKEIYMDSGTKYEFIYDKYGWGNYSHVGKIINESERPVLYIGQGCNKAYRLLRNLAIAANIPVTTTLHALGCFDENHDLALEMCGMHGSNAANMALQHADCIIALGSRFDDRTTGNVQKYAPMAKNIIHVNIEPSEINKIITTDHNFVSDCKFFIQKLLPFIKYNARNNWLEQINKWKIKEPFRYNKPKHKKDIIGQQVVEVLNDIIKDRKDIIITTDVGNHQMWTAQYIKWHIPGRIITSGALGVMGAGTPYAIGSKIGNPDKTVIGMLGDQSFNMSLNDLKTILNYDVDVKLIIFNDSCQSMVNCWEKIFYEGRETATNSINPDFTQLASAYGIKWFQCSNYKKLRKTMSKFINYKGSAILNVILDNDDNYCLPLVKPGCGLHEMVLPDDIISNMGGCAPN